MNIQNSINTLSEPNIFKYDDILQYLNDQYTYLKTTVSQFNYDQWSYTLGYDSRSFMYLICSGKRQITLDTATRLINYFKFNNKQSLHFLSLIEYKKTKFTATEEILKDKVLESLDFNEDRFNQNDYADFLSNTDLVTIYNLLSFNDAEGTIAYLKSRLDKPESDIESALKKLLEMNLIQEQKNNTEKEIVYKSLSINMKIPDQEKNTAINIFHENILSESLKILASHNEENKFRSTLFAINPEKKEDFNNEIEAFFKKIKHKYACENINGNEIIRLNLQAYKL